MKAVRTGLVLCAICALALLVACTGTVAPAPGVVVPAASPVSLAEAHISALVVLDSTVGGGDPQPATATVSVVALDGHVTTRTLQSVSAMGFDDMALSPDGHLLLYPTRGHWGAPYPFSSLHELDLDTGRDSVVIPTPPVAWGWDSQGRIVAITSQPRWTVWRGQAGDLQSAPVQAHPSPVDVRGFLSADASSAYFGGDTVTGAGDGPSLLHIWRYDFATHALTRTVTSQTHGGLLGARPGQTYSELHAPGFSDGGTPSSDPVTGGLRRFHYVIEGRSFRGGFSIGTDLRLVDVLRPSDMRVLRSVVITPVPAFDPRGYPPVFDASLTSYVEGIAPPTAGPGGRDTGPARLAEVDIATNAVHMIDAPPSAFTQPLGYLGSSSAFVYRAVDRTRVGAYLKEPGKPSRLILALGRVLSPAGPLDDPALLGVQYGR
jgi:hypothetical protein